MSTGGTPTPIPTGGKYQSGDRCFSKLKGWPWWPSRVKERISGKVEAYKVYFYGTYDEATVKLDQMMEYNEENFEKMGKKPPRNAKFPLAMKEIEQNMDIHDSNATGGAVTQNPEQANEGGDEGELLIDEGPPVLTKEGKTPRPAAVQKKNSRALSPDMTEEIPKPTPKKGVRGSKATLSTPTPTVVETSDPAITPAEPLGLPQPEIVSRSGRKIKPKRFADDFDTGTKSEAIGDTPPANKRVKRTTSVGNKTLAMEDTEKVTETAQALTGKRKSALARQSSAAQAPLLTPKIQPKNMTNSRGPPPLTKGKPDARTPKGGLSNEEAPLLEDSRFAEGTEQAGQTMEFDENEESNLLYNGAGFFENTEEDEFDEDEGLDDSIKKIPITGANGVELEVRVNTKIKDRIKSQKERANFERTTKRNVERMKAELGKSEEAATAFLEAVAEGVAKDEELNDYTVSKLKENTQQKIQVWRSEGETIELIAELVSTFGLKEADAEKGLDLLEKLGNQKLDAATLKKNPEVVDTIKQLRRYEGNLDEWAFTTEQKTDFEKKAEQIRNKSEAIYQYFKSLFCSNAPKPFPVAEVMKPEPETVEDVPESENSPLPSTHGVAKDPSEEPETPAREFAPKLEISETSEEGQEEKVKTEDVDETQLQPLGTEENETSGGQIGEVALSKTEGLDSPTDSTNRDEAEATSPAADAPAELAN